ncbi:MAG: hypothetical protein LUQ31_07785 [Methanoregula sp.]|nr:hypothetical protein [Methanoregula sp.]
MNDHKQIFLLSIVLIACIAVAVLGAFSLYGTMTRIDDQPVLVDGRSYPNTDVAAIMVLIGDGVSSLVLLPHAPLTAIPALATMPYDVLVNTMIMTLAVTALASAGAILALCLLVLGRKQPSAGPAVPEKH